MTLKHFKIFSVVYSYCSFTKAAENLGLTQPAVSIAIREMEEHYGVEFFIRSKKKLIVTKDGQKMIHFVNNILRQMSKAENAFSQSEDVGILRIGSNVTSAASYLSNIIIKNFSNDDRKKLFYFINNSSKIEKMVYQGELDIGIIDIPSNIKDLISLPVTNEEMALLSAPEIIPKIKTSLSLKDVASLPLLLREEGSGSRECLDNALSEVGLHPSPIMESTNNNTLFNAAKRGLGVLFAPKNALISNIKRGKLIELNCNELHLTKRQYFIIREDTRLTPEIILIIKKLSQSFPDSALAKYYQNI